jgi:type IV pilus assembly protein PilF
VSRRALALAAVAAVALAGCASPPPPYSDGRSQSAAAQYNTQLGVAYLQQGNLQLAKDKLEKAQQQNPDDANLQTSLGLLYERLGDQRLADRHYRRALQLEPRNPDVSNNYAVYLCRTGRVDEGVKRFEEAARNPLYRTPEAAFTNAGVCLRSANRPDEAEKSFQRALAVRPNFAEAALQIGDLNLQRGRLVQARAGLDQYLLSFAATPDLLLLGVRIAQAQGDRAGAERYARKLRLDFPNSEQARAVAERGRNPG